MLLYISTRLHYSQHTHNSLTRAVVKFSLISAIVSI